MGRNRGVGSQARRVAPGLAVLAAGAVAAKVLGDAAPVVSPLVVAVALGALASNAFGRPERFDPGLSQGSLALETGIVLLGASIALDEVARSGALLLALVVGTVLLGVVFVDTLARRGFGLGRKPAALLAAGSSICGVSAVVAVAGAVDADGEDITFAAATVLLFDAVTLVAFPIVGEALGLTSQQFGVWAGLSMFSTGPVAAAGFAFSPVAGEWATLTKLVRNSLIGVLAVAYSLSFARGAGDAETREVWTRFPKFLFGFAVVAAVANLGVLSAASLSALSTAADWLFLLAFVGLGFDIRLGEMRGTGIAPVGVVFVHLLVVSVATGLVVTAVF
jgi:uncharacterized integral membrane protein (TIGR00698 family)